MKNLQSPLFLTASILFIVNQLLEHLQIHLPFVHAYLDDLLCFPIVLSLILFVFRNFVYQSPTYQLSPSQVFFAVVYFSFIFEGVLPYFSTSYTADLLDVVFYGIGAFVFFRWMQDV